MAVEEQAGKIQVNHSLTIIPQHGSWSVVMDAIIASNLSGLDNPSNWVLGGSIPNPKQEDRAMGDGADMGDLDRFLRSGEGQTYLETIRAGLVGRRIDNVSFGNDVHRV
ncbi:MAG: hypothetical protein SGJ20_00725, partial [Planctomycetota bacterium]|nr:hypothetical protein [Planctomycetota bacterium]